MVDSMIRARFGTWRGGVRLALSYGQVALGMAAILAPDPARVRRLVFVCQGNICRSAFADHLARQAGARVASFGLSTTRGIPAHGPAIVAARSMGQDLSAHRAARVEDFVPEPGDLLLAMEVRQLHRLAARPALVAVPRSLLGLWADPVMPHLHDPFGLDDLYMGCCLRRVERAVARVIVAFPGVRGGDLRL